MSVLDRRLRRGAGPEAVARTFQKINVRLGRKADNVVHRENERPLDKTVEQQPMLIRIDRRHPGMMPLEMQTIRRDDPMQVLPWRHRRGGSSGRRRSTRPADDVFLERRRLPIRGTEKRRPLFLHPCGHVRWQIVVGGAGRCRGESGRSSAASKRDAAGEQLAARDVCLVGLPFGHP
jgi:hypothetical protein